MKTDTNTQANQAAVDQNAYNDAKIEAVVHSEVEDNDLTAILSQTAILTH